MAYSGLSWTVISDNYLVAGEISTNQNTITIMAAIPYAAPFAVWYRNLVPSYYQLQIVDFLGNHAPFEIKTHTTVQEIIQAFS
jgi:hypothetical protein